MRTLYATIFFLLAITFKSSAQHAMRANRAGSHVGEYVMIIDSVSFVKLLSDSTGILGLGQKDQAPLLNIIVNFKLNSNSTPDILTSLKGALIEVGGNVVLVSAQPTIYKPNSENIYIYSRSISQNWQALSQLSSNTEQKLQSAATVTLH